ncbi:2-amino-4-hydroxy-6-hydroxymethyldihydropteridine diphosphokinase [Glaciecola siphonariae]|uniref:2-amino-4-hydroxy-6-hydroxymethyldihydropteridine pyrophosphokinase n=1 Tax=Glaciecola siphonariae TaxID=521012 RepID=A0ABV9LXH5_9ALTE
MMSDSAYIGLGSNLASPSEQIKQALVELHAHHQICVQRCSHLYQSAPMGPKDQPDYVNAVCRLTTSLAPLELLDILQDIEQNHGRERIGEKWGPRTLDLDMLMFNELRLQSERLILPHYGMSQREFVLVPLFEIAPDLIMQDGQKLATWVSKCNLVGLKRLPGAVDFASIAA